MTSVARTLLDLAATLDRAGLERALAEAEYRRLGGPLSLPCLLARHPRRRGSANLRAILAERAFGTSVTRSELEQHFLTFAARAGLPRPAINLWLQVSGRWREADCVWREQQLIVELDGYAGHGTKRAFERDRERDRTLVAAGWRVVRITWRQLHEDESLLAADLRRLLAVRRG